MPHLQRQGVLPEAGFETQEVSAVCLDVMEGIGKLGQEHPQASGVPKRRQPLLKLLTFRGGPGPGVGKNLPKLGGEAKLRICRHRRQPAARILGRDGPVKGDIDLHHVEERRQEGKPAGAL